MQRMRRPACALLSLAVVAGCGGGDTEPAPPRADAPQRATPTPTPAKQVRRAHCDPAADNCAVATGRVVYVEAVDPDGDGDAHYVTAGGRITAPGLSVIDVRRDLR